MNSFFRCIFAIALWVISIIVKADIGHVIVAFDRAIPIYESIYRSDTLLSNIDSFIKKELRSYNRYVSVVGYVMNGSSPDINDFVLPYTDTNDKAVLWKDYKSLSKIFPKWPHGEPAEMNYYKNPGSMQSLAKPYCVMETAVNNINLTADATFIIFVTDEEAQGVDDDYNREWGQMRYYNTKGYDCIRSSVFEKLKQFNEAYRFELRERKTIVGGYVIALYELLPAVQPSIYSVSDLPSSLPIKRVRGGYKLDCQVASHNPYYEIKDWAVYNLSYANTLLERKEKIHLHELKDGDTLEIRMLLRMSDSLYGGFKLSRKNCTGLALKQVFRLSNEDKVFGILPLSDTFWWWFSEDVALAVVVWDVILLLVFIIIICILTFVIFKKITCYIPENEVIKISRNN